MMNKLPTIELQRQAVDDFFSALAEDHEHLPYVASAAEAASSGACQLEELAA
jgi:hypothetical protein